MRILFIGDIVGRPGKHACTQLVPKLREDLRLDLVVANSENIAAGSGMTPQMFNKLRHQGVDCCTMGDHIYRRREILELLNSSDRIVKPANLPREAAGREFMVVQGSNDVPVAVVSLLGRTFMNLKADCPFHGIDRVLQRIPSEVRVILVDMHAETTSEKIAMGWYLDGRVTAMVGTHTHIPTADERVLPKGTGYITDLGMTGPYDSVLGRDKTAVIKALCTSMHYPYNVATDDVRLSGVVLDINEATGRTNSIERISVPDPGEPDSSE